MTDRRMFLLEWVLCTQEFIYVSLMAPNCLLNFDDDSKTKPTNLQYAIGKDIKKFLHSNLFDYNGLLRKKIFKMRIYFIHLISIMQSNSKLFFVGT